MLTGHVIYGVGGRRRYACTPLDEHTLFRVGAEPDALLPGALAPGEDNLTAADLPDLPLIDYELILAHLYAASFGEIIGQNVDCSECRKKFAVEFSLPDWVGNVRAAVTRDQGTFDGGRYSLPTRRVLGQVARDPVALAQRLWQGDNALPPDRIAAFEAHLARACPILRDEIEAPCPRCNEIVRHRFVLRRHLAQRLQARLRALLADIHVLAASYHWSARDILALPLRTRTALVDMVRAGTRQRRALAAG